MGAFVSFPLFPWQDFAIYHNEFAVELFVGAFPAVVAPEVEAWVAADGLFEELEEAACHLIFGEVLRGACDEVEAAGVIAAAGACHIDIEDGVVHLAHYPFGAGEHGRVVIEEREPQVYVLPLGTLVGDVAEKTACAFAPECEEAAQDVLLGHHYTRRLRRTESLEEYVEGLRTQGMIDESALALRLQGYAHA